MIPEDITAKELVNMMTEPMNRGGRQGKPGDKSGQVEAESVDMQALMINCGLVVFGLICMWVFVRVIEKR